MDFQTLLDPETQKFIAAHEKDDVAKLALAPLPDQNWDRSAILNQIKARQKAVSKIPQWLEHKDIVLPQPHVIEQASSFATAHYKASLLENCKVFADLTGGTGIDTYAFANRFEQGICVEKNPDTAALLRHNLAILTGDKVEVICDDAQKYIDNMPDVDIAFIDPQRRDEKAKGKFKFEDCSPNIIELLPTLKNKAKRIIIKASPMIDLSQGIEELGCVEHIHILEKDQNCKEVLFVLNPHHKSENISITAVSLDETGQTKHSMTFSLQDETAYEAPFSQPQTYIYEPGPAFLKSGGLKILCREYAVSKLHPSTHLYTSENLIPDFPGRVFGLSGISKAQANDIPEKKGNLAVRNFPMSVEKLRKKLRISDGGSVYYFACTLMDERKVILICKKT